MDELPSYNRIAPDVRLGKDVRLFGFVNLYGCSIGDETRIGTFVEVQKNASIGARCKISSHTFICEGVTIEDEVFIGHGVMFLNDADPYAVTDNALSTEADWTLLPTRVCRGAAIGSGAVLLGGITVGEGALVGAGAVVTHDVAPHTVVVGNPARFLRPRRREIPAPSPPPESDDEPPAPIPFTGLGRQDPALQGRITAALQEIVESGAYILGPRVARFEQEFAAFLGSRHCIAVNSGTSALHLALLGAGVRPGDEVITVPMTFVATAWAISYVGATPVFVDVDPITCTLDTAQLERRIGPRTRAILPVHLYGQAADMAPILEIAARYNIPVVEDAAQAAGTHYFGRPAGTLGRCGCFSFYPSKNLGACGEAGAIVTESDALAARLRALRDHAQETRHQHEEIGYNYRMDAFQGAALSARLPCLNTWVAQRRRLADRYLERLAHLSLQLPARVEHRLHSWHLFVVRHPERDRLRCGLEAHGIATGLHYPIPIHLQRAYAHLCYPVGAFPVAERIARECLTLPLFPEMTECEQDRVIQVLTTLCRKEPSHAA